MPERRRFKGMENGGFAVPGPFRKSLNAFSVEEAFFFKTSLWKMPLKCCLPGNGSAGAEFPRRRGKRGGEACGKASVQCHVRRRYRRGAGWAGPRAERHFSPGFPFNSGISGRTGSFPSCYCLLVANASPPTSQFFPSGVWMFFQWNV